MNQKPCVHHYSGNKWTLIRRQAGVTIVELLVVISIASLLLAIGFALASKFNAEARRTQTKAMLEGLIGANVEFRAVRQQGNINHDGVYPINWAAIYGADEKNMSSSERFVVACKQIPAAEQIMLAAIFSGPSSSDSKLYANRDKDSNSGNDAYEELYDRWGTPLEYRSSNDGGGDGPSTNTAYGSSTSTKIANSLLPISRSPFFVSAGPDKEFGTDDDINSLPNGSVEDN